MEKNDKTGKKSYDELENSAQGLLRRLNNRYDATRVEAEKSAMKNMASRPGSASCVLYRQLRKERRRSS